MIGIANIMDLQIIGKGSIIRMAMIFFYISNEGMSLFENVDRLGLSIPVKIKGVLVQLHDKAEKEESGSPAF